MRGEKAERFVRLNLLLMAGGFALVGFFFIAWPDGTLARLTEFGDNFGDFAPAPETDERLWLSLGFAYMVVITFLALIAASDVVRYRPMLLALAAGKAASSRHLAGLLRAGRRLRLSAEWDRGRLPRGRLAAALAPRGQGRRARGARLKARAGAGGRRAAHAASDRRGGRPR